MSYIHLASYATSVLGEPYYISGFEDVIAVIAVESAVKYSLVECIQTSRKDPAMQPRVKAWERSWRQCKGELTLSPRFYLKPLMTAMTAIALLEL